MHFGPEGRTLIEEKVFIKYDADHSGELDNDEMHAATLIWSSFLRSDS